MHITVVSTLIPLLQIVEAVSSSDSIVQVNFYVTDLRTNTVVAREMVIVALNAVPDSRLDEVTGYNVSLCVYVLRMYVQ